MKLFENLARKKFKTITKIFKYENFKKNFKSLKKIK